MTDIKNRFSAQDLIFYLGVALMPFDNLFFAPSSGWATIAPFLFFIYVLINFNKIKFNQFLLLFLGVLVSFSILGYVLYSISIANLIDSVATIVLGVSFFLALKIFFIDKGKNPSAFLSIIFYAYLVAFIYGLLFLLNIPAINNIMQSLQKRTYDRLQFTFTEPSFISMHMFGVLLPICLIFKKQKNCLKIKILICLYALLTVIASSSTRFLLDTVVVVCILGLAFLFKGGISLKKLLILLAIILAFVVAIIVFRNNPRIKYILEYGIYADASLASRWFRINAILKGLVKKPLSFLFGCGIGNASIPFNLGYDGALLEYINPYLAEVEALKNTTEVSFFCGHIRVIAESGLFIYLFIILYLMKNSKGNYTLFFIIMYLYLQFDSYAFYAIWLLLFAGAYNRSNKEMRFN